MPPETCPLCGFVPTSNDDKRKHKPECKFARWPEDGGPPPANVTASQALAIR